MGKRETVLVCAAHPDDEILGCGATMARHVRAGDDVHAVILGRGVASRGDDGAAVEALEAAARRANAIVGVTSLRFFDFPDNRMDTVDRLSIAKCLEEEIARVRPSIVYTHHRSDLNVDHGRVADAAAIAARPLPGSSVASLLFFEVASSTDARPAGVTVPFEPNWFVDVSATLEFKLAALREYAAEMRAFPHPRSIEAVEHLARWRGAMAGVAAAEAFVAGRHIVAATVE
jgi:LmbE family N-acetylglucosaminyl deacetylase